MNFREINLFLMLTCLMTIPLFGWSIRDYFDKSDYIKLSITLGMVVIIILIARFFSKIAFGVNKITNKDLNTQGHIV